MLAHLATEVLQVEFAIPVGHHRLVVVGPAVAVGSIGVLAVGAHHLYVVHTHHRRQLSVVIIGISHCFAGIMDFFLSGKLTCRNANQYHDKKYEFEFFHLEAKIRNTKIIKFLLNRRKIIGSRICFLRYVQISNFYKVLNKRSRRFEYCSMFMSSGN